MLKTIVFCADGTWNGPPAQTGVSAVDGDDDHGELASAAVTNVVKLFSNLTGQVTPQTLALADEQEKALLDASGNTLQIAKYMHGVGDSGNLLDKLLGGAFGMGVIARIVRGFTFISRNFLPGDAIHIAGFSRGAYTARALAGMIAKVGLLNPAAYDPTDQEKAYRLGVAAWCKSKEVSLLGSGKLTDIATHLLAMIEGMIAEQLPPDGLLPDINIKSVAVWDTVGSMGIPLYAGDARYDIYRFVDTALSPQVANGFHAMAIDELRVDFPVTRWDTRAGVDQVWFVGAHSDVGGGYPAAESGLSDITLDWMMRKLGGVGVQLASPLAYAPSGAGGNQAIHTPWKSPPFDLMEQSPRQVLASDVLHSSVLLRCQTDPGYQPQALATVRQQGLTDLRQES